MNEKKLDSELVKMAQAGDLAVFSELVRRCRSEILIELTGLTGNIYDAEDVLQEALLRSFLKIQSLKEPYNFGGWLRLIARNIAKNRLLRKPKIVELKEDSIENLPEVETDTSDRVLQTELALRALSRLSPKLRETTRLTYLTSYSQRQVAEMLGVPLGTVKSRLCESRIKMKKEVLNMSRAGRTDAVINTVPAIKVKELSHLKMSVLPQGPGLYFGTVLKEGLKEVCHFFDYPGGILTQTVFTQVVKKVEISGRECFEVLVEHTDCEPATANVLQYFTVTDRGFEWVMMTNADELFPQTRFFKLGEEVFPSSYSSGESEEYSARVVNLTIGSTNYGQCLAVFWNWQTGTPAESFFTKAGRQVLHRRYSSPDVSNAKSSLYNNLPEDGGKNFRGIEYRLWYDTVLIEDK